MNNIIFYSVNTFLANHINKEYYHDTHYVWVAPFFNCGEINPNSSNPEHIYETLKNDVKGKKTDRHSLFVNNNRIGIKKGAIEMFKAGAITKDIKYEIIELSKIATLDYFEPLIYIIPAELVKLRVQTPHFKYKANLTSSEYIIKDLKSHEFDIIKL